jgi:hypothetical protein
MKRDSAVVRKLIASQGNIVEYIARIISLFDAL